MRVSTPVYILFEEGIYEKLKYLQNLRCVEYIYFKNKNKTAQFYDKLICNCENDVIKR